jgi:hypothetical protein
LIKKERGCDRSLFSLGACLPDVHLGGCFQPPLQTEFGIAKDHLRTIIRSMRTLLVLSFLILSGNQLIAAGRAEPQVQIDTFFKDLSENGGSAAMKELCEGTLLEAQKGVQLETYAPQLDTSLKVYGTISRVESVEKKLFGESFVRTRLITYHSSGAPLFWEFMFFRSKGEWQIYVFRFSDQIYRVFSEVP